MFKRGSGGCRFSDPVLKHGSGVAEATPAAMGILTVMVEANFVDPLTLS